MAKKDSAEAIIASYDESNIHADSSYQKLKNNIVPTRKKAEKSRHYVDNQALFADVVRYNTAMADWEASGRTGKRPVYPNSIGSAVMAICHRTSLMPNFAKYPYREEMVNAAVEKCISKIANFNPAKTQNPFAYFTTIAYYSYIEVIEAEQLETYLKFKGLMNALGEHDVATMPEQGSEYSDHAMDNMEVNVDRMVDFVKFYEERMARRKAKMKERALANKVPVCDNSLLIDDETPPLENSDPE